MQFELAVVMPVYNEEEIIGQVVRSWREELERLGIAFHMLVLNDGSKDQTAKVLEAFQGDPRITLIHKANSGHGPTILQGYRQAIEIAPWVFQTDSDNEMPPEHFPALWEKREDYDGLFGYRVNREQSLGRQWISAGSRAAVRLRFGRGGVHDVNVPYRLMRSTLLRPMLERVPAHTWAPNVLLAGGFNRAGARIANFPVPHAIRKTGQPSVANWKWLKVATKSLWQTLTYPV